jgi:hypothetical protein
MDSSSSMIRMLAMVKDAPVGPCESEISSGRSGPLTFSSCGNPCDGFRPTVLVLSLRILARPHERGRVMQPVVGFYHLVHGMTTVHTSPALHPHEALSPPKIEKLVFYHQALTTGAWHDLASSRVIGERSGASLASEAAGRNTRRRYLGGGSALAPRWHGRDLPLVARSGCFNRQSVALGAVGDPALVLPSTKKRDADSLALHLLIADRRWCFRSPGALLLAHRTSGVAVSEILSLAYSYARLTVSQGL